MLQNPKLMALVAKLSSNDSFAAMFRVVMMRSLAFSMTVFTGLLTAAVLGPAGRGEQAAMIVAPQFLAGLASLGLHASLIYNMKTDPEQEWKYLGANLIMTSVSACAIALCGWFVLPLWLRGFDEDVLQTARWLLCVTPLLAMSWSLTAAAEVRGWFSLVNLMANLQSTVVLVSLLLLILLHRLTPRSSACIYILASVPIFAVLATRLLRAGRPVFTLERAITKRLLHYGLRFYGTDLLGTLSGYLDQIIILPLLTPAAIGIYVVASSLARTLGVLSDAVSSVLFPTVAGKPVAVIVSMVFKTLRITVLVNIVASGILAAAAPLLLMAVYGERFLGGSTTLRILLIASIFMNAARILYQALNALGRPEIVTFVEIIGTSATFGLMLILVPKLGIAGAALAIGIASVLRLLCTFVLVERTAGIRLRLPIILRGGQLEHNRS